MKNTKPKHVNFISFFVLFVVFGQFWAISAESKLNKDEINQKFEIFWPAICKIESNFNPKAIGDGGRAVGIAQIHPECLQDSNEFGKTSFSLADRLDPNKSKTICFNYLARYKKYHNWDLNKMARTWNGGPGGVKSKKTDGYVKKFGVALNNP